MFKSLIKTNQELEKWIRIELFYDIVLFSIHYFYIPNYSLLHIKLSDREKYSVGYNVKIYNILYAFYRLFRSPILFNEYL